MSRTIMREELNPKHKLIRYTDNNNSSVGIIMAARLRHSFIEIFFIQFHTTPRAIKKRLRMP